MMQCESSFFEYHVRLSYPPSFGLAFGMEMLKETCDLIKVHHLIWVTLAVGTVLKI